MKILKSVLGMIVVLCLMMCLAVPAFATSTDTTEGATTSTSEAPTGDTTAEDTAEPEAAEPVTDESATEESAEEHEHDHDHDHDHEAETDTATTGTGITPATDKNKTLRTVLLVLEVITSVALIVVVLLQSGKESGLGKAISGNSNSYMSKNKNANLDKVLASATKWVALAWLVFTLLLGLV